MVRKCDPRALSFELLHALSQPLTALCCSLELALQRPLTPEKYGESVSRALAQVERASWLTMAIRELFDAGQPGENCEVVDLRMGIVRAIGDVALVADAAKVQIVCLPWPVSEVGFAEAVFGEARRGEVYFDELRLRRALFNLLGFVVGSSRRAELIELELSESREDLAIRLTLSCPDATLARESPSNLREQDRPDELALRLGLGIACAIFEAGGGSLLVEDSSGSLGIQIRLPRALR